jgi:hypothetical protein
MRVFTSAACLSAVLLAANGATAQQRPTEFRAGLEFITSGIDPVAADSAGIGSRAYGVQLTGSLIVFRVLSLNAEGGAVGMSDEAPFTQGTTMGDRTSGVTAGLGTLSAGLRTPRVSLGGEGGERPLLVSAGVSAGRTWMNVHRSISQCPDCHSEDVDVRAGSFWEPMLQVDIGKGAAAHARYRTYLGDSDFKNALVIGYSVAAGRRTPEPEETTDDPR